VAKRRIFADSSWRSDSQVSPDGIADVGHGQRKIPSATVRADCRPYAYEMLVHRAGHKTGGPTLHRKPRPSGLAGALASGQSREDATPPMSHTGARRRSQCLGPRRAMFFHAAMGPSAMCVPPRYCRSAHTAPLAVTARAGEDQPAGLRALRSHSQPNSSITPFWYSRRARRLGRAGALARLPLGLFR